MNLLLIFIVESLLLYVYLTLLHKHYLKIETHRKTIKVINREAACSSTVEAERTLPADQCIADPGHPGDHVGRLRQWPNSADPFIPPFDAALIAKGRREGLEEAARLCKALWEVESNPSRGKALKDLEERILRLKGHECGK